MTKLSDDQIAAWKQDGYLYPFPLLDEAERKDCLDGLARFEAWLGAPVNESPDLRFRTMPYLVLPWAAKLAQDPRILDLVEDLIGPDILIYTSTFFIKEAHSPMIAAWHQDSTYYGLAPADEVTVWIALTDASHAAGCIEVVSWEGAPRQMRHATRIVENSVNRGGQRIVETFDDSRFEAMALKAGQFSMHHGLCPHRSGPNNADHRRVGLGLNFIPPHVRPVGTVRPAAMLVRGTDRHGHFELVGPPESELDETALRTHERATGLYRDAYLEEEIRHAKLSA